MSMTIIVTPLNNPDRPQNKAVASIHYGKNVSATVFVAEKQDGSLSVIRPGYKNKNGDFTSFFGLKGEGSIKALNAEVLAAYDRKVNGTPEQKLNPEVTDVDINKIEVVSLGVLDSNNHKKALATVKLNDEFIMNNVDVIEGKNGLFIDFPHNYDKDSKDVHSYVSAVGNVKKQIEEKVLSEYNKKIDVNKTVAKDNPDTKEKSKSI